MCNKEMRKSMNEMERHWKSHHEVTGIDRKVDDHKEEVSQKKEVEGRKQKNPLDKTNKQGTCNKR